MDYPISFNNARVYSVPDTRFIRQGFALQRPTAVLQPNSPITPVNMLPYQMATAGCGVPYGYALVPQAMLGQMAAPGLTAPAPRLMPMSANAGRHSYSIPDEDDEEEYVPPSPRPRPRSRLLDDEDSPEMAEFSASTRQIRKDANALLQRLGTTKPQSRASEFFKTYDYDTKALTSKYLAPPPDRSSMRNASPTLDDDELDPTLQSLRPTRGRRFGGSVGSALGGSSRPVLSTGTDRVFTPASMTANRIQNLYKELDDSLYAPDLKSFDYTECLRRDREATNEKVRANVSRRAALLMDEEPSAPSGGGFAEARENRGSLRETKRLGGGGGGYDSTSVRSNINIRAQYAAMRAAAGRNLRRPTPTLSAEPASAPAPAPPPPPPAPVADFSP